MTPDLVVLGNLLVDDIVYADGTTRMGQAGGAVLYFALAAQLCGLRVGVGSVCGSDYPDATLEALEVRGIDLSGVRRLEGPGLRTWLLDEGRRRQLVHRLEGPSHQDVSPRMDEIPTAWLEARVIHLAPMPWNVQEPLVESLAPRPCRVSLDPFELLRQDNLAAWQGLLAGVDFFFLSEDEMLLEGDPRWALRELVRNGRPGHLFHKRGFHGGRVWDGERWQSWPAWEKGVAETTGAGDAFAAGVLAGWLAGDDVRGALLRGVVAASFAISAPGVEGLLAASVEEAEERRRRWSRDWFVETDHSEGAETC